MRSLSPSLAISGLVVVAAFSCGRSHSVPAPRAAAQALVDAGVDSGRDAGSHEFDEMNAILALPASTSTSIGGPNEGRVIGSVAFPLRGPGFRFGPLRSPDARYGTVEMVQSLLRAARAVRVAMPGSEVTVNDLGLVDGGPIRGHGSHRAGRDVDVLFYLLDENGAPRPGIGAPIEPDGTGTDYKDLADPADDVRVRIDLPRSWAFVAALIADPGAELQRIFVVEHVRTMLLDHARASGADPAIVDRFADLTCQPSYPHDDHFHFRFFCSVDDIAAGCTDSAPLYPWHVDALRQAGTASVPQRISPNRVRSPTTTDAEARADAGTMHADVTAFLARRERWRRQPHPRRTYCR